MKFDYELLEVQLKERWSIIKINRPKALNALNEKTLKELKDAVKKQNEMEEIKAIVITGSGNKAFVAGADIAAMKSMDSLAAEKFSELGQKTFSIIENSPKPVIAAINGFALGGGCELALACDLRIASDNAKFGQPEINLGIIPGFCGTQRLPKLVGIAKAKELIYTGENITAQEAEKIGLINKKVEQGKLMSEVKKLVEQIVDKSPLTINLAKEAVNTGLEMNIKEGSTVEKNIFGMCFSSKDQIEGMDAFLNKRKANFTGN